MAYNTKPIITDVNGNPAPCVFDDSTTADKYTYMRGKDGVGAYYIPVDESGNQLFSPTNPGKVSIGDSVLPTGGATEAKQNDIITALTAQLDITLSALRDAIAGSGVDAKTLNDLWNKIEAVRVLLAGTLTTNVTSSVLPTGASTSAKQDLAKAVLDNIKTAADAIQAAVEGTLNVNETGSVMANDIDNMDIPTAITATQDGNGKAVLRVVDAAPFAYDQPSNRLKTLANATVTSITDGFEYATPTHTEVNVTTSSGVVLAANGDRKYALIVNNSDTEIFLALGTAAVVNKGVLLLSKGSCYEMTALQGNLYAGAIYGIHASSGNKQVLVTEGV